MATKTRRTKVTMVTVSIIWVEEEGEETGVMVVEGGKVVVVVGLVVGLVKFETVELGAIPMGVGVVLKVTIVAGDGVGPPQIGRRLVPEFAKLIRTSTLLVGMEGAFAVIWRKPKGFYGNQT